MTRCDFRTHHECRCNPGQCQQQQARTKTKPSPGGPSMLHSCITAAAMAAMFIGFAILLEQHQARKDRIEQESKAIWSASR